MVEVLIANIIKNNIYIIIINQFFIITKKKLINDNNIYIINKYNMSEISDSNKKKIKKNKSTKNILIIDDELEKLENELNNSVNNNSKIDNQKNDK